MAFEKPTEMAAEAATPVGIILLTKWFVWPVFLGHSGFTGIFVVYNFMLGSRPWHRF
jgi:hypothetical protein